MSKAMTAATKEQLMELMQYLSQNISVPTIGIGGGFAPIGTIISYMGTTAPQDYLICDGTTYNIADYKQLSDFFAAQFGSSNFFGGDGVTTFKVPDLRGEFLRGTGTNSHTNQGSGANVGVHQDGTLMPESLADDNMLAISKFTTTNFDFKVTPTTTGTRSKNSSISSDDWGRQITSRPTNTSVLYCIKAVAAGDVYSTTERVVGTWIDGKKRYRKTLQATIGSDGKANIDCTSLNIDVVTAIQGIIAIQQTSLNYTPLFFKNTGSTSYSTSCYYNGGNKSVVFDCTTGYSGGTAYVTIEYTKTTD